MIIETSEVIEKSFDIFIGFIEFKHDWAGSEELFPEDFEAKVFDVAAKLTKDFSRNSKKYDDGLLTSNIPEIGEALKAAKSWDILLKKANKYSTARGGDHLAFLAKVLESTRPYLEITRELSQKLTLYRNEILNCDFTGLKLEKQREVFYHNLAIKLQALIQSKSIKQHINTNIINVDLSEVECTQSLVSKVEKAGSTVLETLQKITLTSRDYDNIRLLYENITALEKAIGLNIKNVIEKIDKVILKKNTKLQEQSKGEDPKYEKINNSLIAMKMMSHNLPAFKSRIDEDIDEMLLKLKSTKGNMALPMLCTLLQEDPSGVGLAIISEHKIFKGEANRLWATKTQQHGIDYVLINLGGDNIDLAQLKLLYSNFEQEFKQVVTSNLTQVAEKSSETLKALVSHIKSCAGHVVHKPSKVVWDNSVREKIPTLIARIFAFWTLKNTQHYNEMRGISERESYLLKPHPAQIVSIFRILGMGYGGKDTLINNLVQIGTGEGKSVTLAVTACVLALLGMDVSCACYSEYLSSRDYQEFHPIFEALGLVEHIHYGTFDKVCENIINENGDVRARVIDLINSYDGESTSPGLAPKKTYRPKILMIDEVDVFFNKDFYGNLYTPLAALKDPTINALTDIVWSKGKSANFSLIKKTSQYQNCCARFPGWEFLVEEALKDMLADLGNYESHDYKVQNDRIAYKEQDGVSYNAVFGYKTLFAYYHENARGRISRESLEENIKILVHCGSFSYAEIPHKFSFIMGVTGTLATLSDPEKDVIRTQYNIQKNTYMPSVFGVNKCVFRTEDDIFIAPKVSYFMKIRDQIDKRLQGTTAGTKRAVMVFFNSAERLHEFENSSVLAEIKDKVQVMTEEVSLKEKELIIRRATVSDQVTLMTRVFGRGTDFICRNKTVLANGGVHVIQTFLSEEVSEEIQIQGRTARQGEDGSFSMILLADELETFLISREELKSLQEGTSKYPVLNEKRSKFFKDQYATNSKSVQEAKEKHDAAEKLLTSLNSGDINYIQNFLKQENKGAPISTSSRTICLMDATASMGHLLHKAKITVGTMFERASQILKEYGKENNFQLQFVVYRDYDCGVDGILQASPWETKPDNLRSFMNRMPPQGGDDYEEAIEIGLWHANQENEKEKITQVILIGDAPAKSSKQISDYRNSCGGEKLWARSKFGSATHYKTELQGLKDQGIPVHAFYVDSGARSNFQEIARETGGQCEELDVNNSRNGADRLTQVVTELILKDIGQDQGDFLVQQYRKKFVKGFT